MENLNIGIIGTGYLGKLHSKLLVDAERADFIGVYVRMKSKRRK